LASKEKDLCPAPGGCHGEKGKGVRSKTPYPGVGATIGGYCRDGRKSFEATHERNTPNRGEGAKMG